MTSGPSSIALVDVHYQGDAARAACVTARAWTDATCHDEWTADIMEVARYRPGHFFERELPCLVTVLAQAREPFDVVVVDGYVVLDQAGAPGLGGYLFEHLEGRVPIVGVAKRSCAGSDFAARVLRGSSQNPLFVTARGMPTAAAAELVRAMHGAHRIPTLCTRVDQLCRGLLARSGAP